MLCRNRIHRSTAVEQLLVVVENLVGGSILDSIFVSSGDRYESYSVSRTDPIYAYILKSFHSND